MFNKKNQFKKIILILVILLNVIVFVNLGIFFSSMISSKKLSVYKDSQHEIMRIKIYGSSNSKDENFISGSFSIIDTNGNEIAVIERSWNGSYLVVEFCKIRN